MAKKLPDLFGMGEVRVLRLETANGFCCRRRSWFLVVMLLWQRLSGLPVCYGTAEVAPGLIVPNEVPDAYVPGVERAGGAAALQQHVRDGGGVAQAGGAAFPPAAAWCVHGTDGARARADEGTQPEHAAEHSQHGGWPFGVGCTAGHVDALRRVFAGTLPIRDEELAVSLRFQRVLPSPINPWGLALIGLEFSQPLRAETG